jgi:hypothetical protein
MTDVEGNNAAFNNLTVAGQSVSGGGGVQSFCSVHTAAQTIQDSSVNVINTFTTVTNTNPTALSPNSNTGVIINQAGVYHVTAIISWQSGSGSTGVRQLDLLINGAVANTDVTPANVGGVSGNVTRNNSSMTWSQQFNVGDVIGMQGYQNSGNANVINGSLQVWK